MRGLGPAGLLLLPPALAVILFADLVWPSVRATGRAVASVPPLPRMHRFVARLPPGVALPLFLVPEACSRCGTLVSAWLLLNGDVWRALAVYTAAKLVAGSIALWICSACLPALLQIRVVASLHRAVMVRRAAFAQWAASRRAGRFSAVLERLRGRRVRRPRSA